MNLQKLSPWNWFRQEQAQSGELMPGQAGRDLDPFSRMHREMDRMFEDFFGPRGPSGEAPMLLRPSVDIAESKKEYRVSIEVPGVEEDDIDLTVEGQNLILSGEKRQETEDDDDGFHRVERHYGSFRRILTLPEDADSEGISAKFKKGVLDIRIPRTKESSTAQRRIDIG